MDDCKHEHTEIRERTFSNGTVHYQPQCLKCGRAASGCVKREFVFDIENVTEWDDVLADVIDSERTTARVEERADRHADYEDYLASEAWAAKRELVLRREGYICQGCGVARATQAHHTTYGHLRHEFLWELLAVCPGCHDRFHESGRD